MIWQERNSFSLLIEDLVLAYNDATTVSCHVYSLPSFLVIACTFLWGAPSRLAAEHPGLVDKDCPACHVQKVTGKSVHRDGFAMHCLPPEDDARRYDDCDLIDAETKICSACHDESAALRQHVPAVKGQCLECHDAHSSRYRLLLLRDDLQFRTAAIKRK